MKNLLLLTILLAVYVIAVSQSPEKMNYQAVVRNSTGQPVPANTVVSLRFIIHNLTDTGAVVYIETGAAVSNQFGLIDYQIGSAANLAVINWSSGAKYLQVEIDPTGGSNFTDMGSSQLLSVPYALFAGNTVSGGGTGPTGLTGATGVPSIAHQIGDLYEGGIIVSVWEVGGVQHGLIASLVDISTSAEYSNVITTLIGATAQNLTNGSGNSTAIMAQSGATSGAAFLCHSYAGGGYTDWYLPALWELQQCYNAAMIVNTVLGNTNGFQSTGSTNVSYWSSTESGSNGAWLEGFYYGPAGIYLKRSTYSVRAVRRY